MCYPALGGIRCLYNHQCLGFSLISFGQSRCIRAQERTWNEIITRHTKSLLVLLSAHCACACACAIQHIFHYTINIEQKSVLNTKCIASIGRMWLLTLLWLMLLMTCLCLSNSVVAFWTFELCTYRTYKFVHKSK